MKSTTTLGSSLLKNIMIKKSPFHFSSVKYFTNQLKFLNHKNILINKQLKSISYQKLSNKTSFFFSEEKKGPLKA